MLAGNRRKSPSFLDITLATSYSKVITRINNFSSISRYFTDNRFYGLGMKLKDAFDIKSGEIISLVGGGGKTALMFALARELAVGDKLVITTTTTKILEPLSTAPLLLLERDEDRMVKLLLQHLADYRHITLAGDRLPSGKLLGISSSLVAKLVELNPVSYIIIEADGAAQKSLKAPNLTEPVIPDNTSLVVPVVGIDAVGRSLTAENVFRSEIASQLLGFPLGEVISAEAVARLITHHNGIIKGSPAKARIVPFINKVAMPGDLTRAKDLANQILINRHPQIERVILGQAQLPEPVVGIIQA